MRISAAVCATCSGPNPGARKVCTSQGARRKATRLSAAVTVKMVLITWLASFQASTRAWRASNPLKTGMKA